MSQTPTNDAAVPGMIALILLDAPAKPDADEVIAAARAICPELATELSPVNLPGAIADAPLLFKLGEGLGPVLSIDSPAPIPELTEIAKMSWWWPEAGAAIEGHKAHLVITRMSAGEDDSSDSRFDEAAYVTLLTAALVKVTSARAVFWGPGMKIADPAVFAEMTAILDKDMPPVLLWIDFRLFEGEGETIGMITRGLEAFTGREMEIEPTDNLDAQTMVDRGMSLIAYLVTDGDTVSDGDTMGSNETEIIHVRLEDRKDEPNVFILTVEKAA
ncbi:MAG: DUF4261 domain-containing protein [Pseudomonadota bacterium]|nr:DUF4261 domain-containing protein [Pseudomonadota bacterium]